MQSSDLDVTAYGRLVSVANVVTHDVLRLLAAQSVTTYTDTVTMWADRNFSHPLFFTNLEEIGGKIDFNPPLETFTERLLAIMTSAVDTMNKTKALTMSDVSPPTLLPRAASFHPSPPIMTDQSVLSSPLILPSPPCPSILPLSSPLTPCNGRR